MPHNCYSLHNFVNHKNVDQSNLIDKAFDSHQEYTIVTSFRHPPEARKIPTLPRRNFCTLTPIFTGTQRQIISLRQRFRCGKYIFIWPMYSSFVIG